ncbi:MAG: hypothetical protein ACR2NL_05125 [Acidimicrobiia bacterium]
MSPEQIQALPQGRFCQNGIQNQLQFIGGLGVAAGLVGLAAPGLEKIGPLIFLAMGAALLRWRKRLAYVEISGDLLTCTNVGLDTRRIRLDEHTSVRSIAGVPYVVQGKQRVQLLPVARFYEVFGSNNKEAEELLTGLGL